MKAYNCQVFGVFTWLFPYQVLTSSYIIQCKVWTSADIFSAKNFISLSIGSWYRKVQTKVPPIFGVWYGKKYIRETYKLVANSGIKNKGISVINVPTISDFGMLTNVDFFFNS